MTDDKTVMEGVNAFSRKIGKVGMGKLMMMSMLTIVSIITIYAVITYGGSALSMLVTLLPIAFIIFFLRGIMTGFIGDDDDDD